MSAWIPEPRQVALGAGLISRIRDTLGTELPLTTLFDQPMVRGMAAAIDKTKVAINGDSDEYEEFVSSTQEDSCPSDTINQLALVRSVGLD